MFSTVLEDVGAPHLEPTNLPFLYPAAPPAQDCEQLHGARTDCQRALQLLPAASGSVPLYWGWQP